MGIFLTFLIVALFLGWGGFIIIEQVRLDIRYAKLVYITGLTQQQIVEIMNRHNVKDLFVYDFDYDEAGQKYIFAPREIRKWRLQNAGKIQYEFTMETRNQIVIITLLQVGNCDLNAIQRYRSVMDKFMEEKLQARYLDRTQGKEFY